MNKTFFILGLFLLALIYVEGSDFYKTVNENKDASLTSDWWTNAVIYQIYPRSFKDSNNDGIGDLQGVIEKLDYLEDLGVDAIWLSPIYKSPMVDGGYDISDYRDIAEEYGTLDDFKELLDKTHERGLKLILDFVPNHTSDLHEWFQKSVAKEAGYEDYYVWNDGVVDENGTISPPNNWLSIWKYSAWEWNEQRQQYYFHQFAKQQPDLNYRSNKVQQEMKDVMTYWLDLGVDGFRIDAVPHVFEDAQLLDEPVIPDSGVESYDWNSLEHIYTKDQDETFELVYSWRAHMDNYTTTVGGDTRIFMTECASDFNYIQRYYGDENNLGAHFSFNFYLLGVTEATTAGDIFEVVRRWMQLSSGFTQNWLTGNHDNKRVASKVGTKNIDFYNMLITFLDGVTITYMAEEIGQENGEVTCAQGQDPSAIGDCTTFNETSRDFERTPFQWDTTVNGGFNDGAEPWLPVSSKYLETNVAVEKNDENSHYNIYKKLIAMKSQFTNCGLRIVDYFGNTFKALKFCPDDAYEFLYNADANNYTATDLNDQNFTVIVKSTDLQYTPGEPLVLKSGDAIIIRHYRL